MNASDLIFALIATINKSEYSIADLKWLTAPFGLSDSNLRTNLSRMTTKGLLHSQRVGKLAYYSFGNKGAKIRSNVSYSFETPDWSNWDESWIGILFSVPDIEKEERYKIRKKLTAYRFAPFFSGVWIRPYNEAEKPEINLKSRSSTKHCKTIRFFPVEKFGNEDINRIWKIALVNQNLTNGLKLLREKYNELTKLTPEQAFVNKILIGNQIVHLLFTDPLLPDRFLPSDWKGNKLRKEFTEWDKKVSEISKPFWSNITD